MRRLFWLVVGVGFGFGLSFWFTRFVRQTVARYSPEQVSSNLAAAVKGIRIDVRGALSEGRAAMRERESELRAELSHEPTSAASRVRPGREPSGDLTRGRGNLSRGPA